MRTPMKHLICCSVAAVLLFSLSVPSARAGYITFTEPATSEPERTQAGTGNWIVAYNSFLAAPPAGAAPLWDAGLRATLDAQGFSEANGWTHGGYIGLPDDAGFNVTIYRTYAGPVSGGVEIQLTFVQGSIPDPVGGTLHWLQVVNTDQQVQTEEGAAPFGYQIPVAGGYWQLDNGQRAWGPGIGPFYDSNGGPAFSLTFNDMPEGPADSPERFYRFWLIPTWDILQADGTHTLVFAEGAVFWGFWDPPGDPVAMPEPPTFWLCVIVLPILYVAGRWRAARNHTTEAVPPVLAA